MHRCRSLSRCALCTRSCCCRCASIFRRSSAACGSADVRLALVLAGIVFAVGAAVATINGVVDPKDKFYSGAPLTAALESRCLLADDVVGARSYPEFKRDLFRRRKATTVVVGSSVVARGGVNMTYPGFGPAPLLDTMRFLARSTPKRRRLTIYVQTAVSWFDPQRRPATIDESLVSKVGYRLSPWTLAASLDLSRYPPFETSDSSIVAGRRCGSNQET